MSNFTDLVGRPFDLQGKNGFNCYSLCREVCGRKGINLPDKQPAFTIAPILSERAHEINSGKADYVPLLEPEPFCVVTFRIHPKFVTHTGVVLEDCLHFIHIMKKSHVVIERLDLPRWRKRLDGFYRFVGVDNAGK